MAALREKYALFKNGQAVSATMSWGDVRQHALKTKAAFIIKYRSNKKWNLRDGYEIREIA